MRSESCWTSSSISERDWISLNSSTDGKVRGKLIAGFNGLTSLCGEVLVDSKLLWNSLGSIDRAGIIIGSTYIAGGSSGTLTCSFSKLGKAWSSSFYSSSTLTTNYYTLDGYSRPTTSLLA